jgi:hypothetical protein
MENKPDLQAMLDKFDDCLCNSHMVSTEAAEKVRGE